MEEPPPPPYSPKPHPSQLLDPTTMRRTIKNTVNPELESPTHFVSNRPRLFRRLLMNLLLIDYSMANSQRLEHESDVGALFIARQLEAFCYTTGRENNAIYRLVRDGVAVPAAQLGVPFDIVVAMLVRFSVNLRPDNESKVKYTGCLAAVYAKHGEVGMLEKCQRDLNEVVDVVVDNGPYRAGLRSRIEAIIAHRSEWAHLQWTNIADEEFLRPAPLTAEHVALHNNEPRDIVREQTTLDGRATQSQIQTTNTPQLVAPERRKSARHQPRLWRPFSSPSMDPKNTTALIKRYHHTRTEYRRRAAALRQNLGALRVEGSGHRVR
ncbi:hypothetical protein LTR17_007881 [Elasticomyces elasticus]|nr:hypothetical protein LTR17_007881 [Elasticomyces elasticus]